VDDVVKALKSKSYAPRAPAHDPKPQSKSQHAAPIPSIVGTSNAEYEPHLSRSTDTPPLHAPKGPAATRTTNAQHRVPDRPTGHASVQANSPGPNTQQASRKRKQVERDASETREDQDSHYSRVGAGGRPIKQTARRGGRGGLRGGVAAFEPQNGVSGFAPMSNMLNMANLPPPPPGPVPFGVDNPMAFFALMASLGTNMPGMPQLPFPSLQGNGTNGQMRKGKCYDYHERGYCRLGMMCSFEHEPANSDSTNVPEYDPDQPGLGTRLTPMASKRLGTNRTLSTGNRGGHVRAPFSVPGPSRDHTNSTLVVESIPEDKFSEDDVRDFFSEFGTILDVQMHAYKRLAIIKFEDHATANRAYMSPKAVFENRFVKVYWYREDLNTGVMKGTSGDMEMADGENYVDGEGETLNLEEIAERQAKAQKAFEERRKKVEEADAKAADIERKLKETDTEMKKIKAQIAELTGEESHDSNGRSSPGLVGLQAEAESLFAQNDSTAPASRGRGFPPRGAYRGRGSAPFGFRGRGAPRGAYRGRGTFATPFAGNRSSVKRLDNRPRRLAVSDVEKGTPKDEALRQYLVVSQSNH
jgi:RNA recognition motif-containing protein